MRKVLLYSLIIAFSVSSASGLGAAERRLTAFCGAASKPALEEVANVFEEKTGGKVDLHFSGSGTMLSRMKMSRRGDLYIPGSPDYMAKAEREGVVDPKTVKIVAYLVIAIDVQHGNPRDIQTLSDLARPGIKVGIGNPEAVCVGLYAVELLERYGLLRKVRSNIVTHAPSCSATASLLVMKKVDAIIGWRVFSKWNPDKIDAVLLRPDQVPRLAYIPAAISSYSQDKKNAQKFLDFLTSPDAKSIFDKWGYIAIEEEARKHAAKAEIGGEYRLPKDYGPLVRR